MEKKKNELIFITIIEVLANEEWCSDCCCCAGVGFGWSWNRELRVLWLFSEFRVLVAMKRDAAR